jgi:hypothetical protein
MLGITLSYDGSLAADQELDLYDLSQAMLGFQRSLALTTNLAVNGNIITQAPKMKGARIHVTPFYDGSFKIPSWVVLTSTAIFTAGTADKETPVGHMVHSMYDYVVSEVAGFHVDYDKSLGQQFEELKSDGVLKMTPTQEKMDSLIEKCEVAVKEMHRPIIWSETAKIANLTYISGKRETPSDTYLDQESFEYIDQTERGTDPIEVVGKVSSYNINTFKGRVYSNEERRPIPFELNDILKKNKYVRMVTTSLRSNAISSSRISADLRFVVFENRSQAGRLKSYSVIDIEKFD